MTRFVLGAGGLGTLLAQKSALSVVDSFGMVLASTGERVFKKYCKKVFP